MSRVSLVAAPKRVMCLAVLSLSAVACGGGGGGGTAPPVNRAPIANAGADQAAIVGEQVTLNGTATDPDNDTLTLAWTFSTRPVGSQATLTGATTASPRFVPDLGGRYTLRLVANDGELESSDEVIVDANTRPVAIAGPDQIVDEGSVVTLDAGSSSDADGDPLSYLWTLTRPAGSQAVLTDPGAAMPSFQADVPGQYVATLVVDDGRLESAGDITLIAVNQVVVNTPPMANAGSDQAVTVGALVMLDGTASSDADGDPLGYSWTLSLPTGSAANLSDATAPAPTFVADVVGTYTAALVVNDGKENSTPDTVDVVVSPVPANTPPVADAGPDQIGTTGDPVALDGSGSTDPDGDNLSFMWALSAPPDSVTAALSDPAAESPTFTPDVAGTYTATLIVSDGAAASAPDFLTVIVSDADTNTPPVANAGGDQSVISGNTVVLDGTGSSDADGDVLTYAWTLSRPEGSQSALSDPASPLPDFTPDTAGVYLAQLIVGDGSVTSEPDVAVITAVSPPANTPPVADAGINQSVTSGDTVLLDGTDSSDADGDILSFSWSLQAPEGSNASLSAATASAPAFVADVSGQYTATLIVNDGTEDSAPDGISITATDTGQNAPPVASAGSNQSVQIGPMVQLDGSASTDPENDPLTYAWTLTAPPGSAATLSDPSSASPTFPADVAGDYSAVLIVNDGVNDSVPDETLVTASVAPPANTAPVARAGNDSSAEINATIQLDGTASSDADGDALTYAWTLGRPSGSTAQLSSASSPTPTFTADVAGVYTAILIVEDGSEASAPDSVSVTVLNGRPTANAGPDQSVNDGAVVALDGGGSSDPDGQPLSYTWTLSRPAGSSAQLADAQTATPNFVADVAGTFTASLVVNDGTESSAPDTVNVLVNGSPVASAGPDQEVNAGVLVSLDGSASSDPDGDPLSYNWVLNRPQGSQAALSNPSAPAPTFVADVGGAFALTLTVSDGKAQDTDSLVVDANTLPTADAGADLDVDTGVPVTLDGSGSNDADGDALGFSWSLQVPAGSAAALSDPTAESPTFTPEVEGIYTATLVVDDGRGASTPDTVVITATNPEVVISGTVTFDRVPHSANGGLEYPGTFPALARGVTVEAVEQGGPVLATTVTNAAGGYTLKVPPATGVFLRVRAEMVRTGTPAWDIRVVDNTAGGALYSLQAPPFDSGIDDLTVDLHAASGWDADAGSYTSVRAAAPFAVLDSIYDAIGLIVEADSFVVLPALVVNWSPLNTFGVGCNLDPLGPDAFDPATGAICTSAYLISSSTGFDGQMFVLGAQDDDTDEYDDHVITHEFAHYLEDRLGRTDSVGGSHSPTDILDPRVAFSEGWANAFSAMALGDPVYKDALSTEQGFGFAFDIESNNVNNEGWYNESSIQSVLYDIYDSASDGIDATSAGFAPIFEGMTNWQANTTALTSVFSFIPDLKSLLPADAANIDALLGGQSIVGSTMDIWGSTETNDAGNAQDVLPVYTDLTVGSGNSVEVCSISEFGDYNRLSNRRFVRFDVVTGREYRIHVIGAADSDPDIALFEQGLSNLAQGGVAGEENMVLPLGSGKTYVISVYDACIVYGSGINAVCPNNTKARSCMTVSVEPL